MGIRRTTWLGLALLAGCAFKLTEVERAELPGCSGPFADECKQCLAGVTSACGRLADRYEHGYGVRVDDRVPGLLRAHACELGDTASCFRTAEAVDAGLRLEYGGIAATDRVTICQRAKIGCGVGSGELCTVVARCAQRRDKDDPEAQALLVRTCAKGYGPACYYAAFRAPGDDGTTEMYRRGCALGYAPACVEHAYMQSIGRGIPADPAAGLATYTKACADTGSFAACAGARGYRPLARMKGISSFRLPSLRWPEKMERGRQTVIPGICLDDNGRVSSVEMLQPATTTVTDAMIANVLSRLNFGADAAMQHRCWYLHFNLTFS